jgi:hypothetical protein
VQVDLYHQPWRAEAFEQGGRHSVEPVLRGEVEIQPVLARALVDPAGAGLGGIAWANLNQVSIRSRRKLGAHCRGRRWPHGRGW